MAVIFETDELRTDEILAAVRLESTKITLDRDIHDAISKDRHSLVVIGPSIPMRRVAELSDYYRIARPALGIIVVRSYIEPKDLKLALDSGVRSVVSRNNVTELQKAVSRSLRLTDEILNSLHAGADSRLATTLCFFGLKGGVGKTTLAVNTALALSQIGSTRVCVVDLNFDSGDVGVFLSQSDGKNLSALSRGDGELDANIVEQLAYPISKKLDAFLSPSNPVEAETIDPNRVMELISLLRRPYDFVILDTSGSFSELNLQVLKSVDHVYTVLTPELPAIKDAKISLRMLEGLGIARSRREVILNKSRRRTGLKTSEIERLLDEEINLIVPSSEEALVALNSGWVLLDYRPGNPISKAIRKFAAQLLEGRIPGGEVALPDTQSPTVLETPEQPAQAQS